MSLSNPKSQTGNVSKAMEKLLNELNVIREREVELLRAELRNKDDEVRVRKEELRLQAEELEARLDEFRTTNEEMESNIRQCKLVEQELQDKQAELEARAEELKAQREECLAKNAELEVQVRERNRVEAELNDAKTQAELYLELMGHDISNMHQVIMSQLEMAREKLDTNGKLKAADRELIDNSISTLDRSARLIENVQNLQKLRSGELKEEVIDLDDLLAGIAKEYGKILSGGSIKFSSCGPCPVRANKLLHDVFTNLVGNAVKHYDGNNIKIKIGLKKVVEDGKDQYKVIVEDNGPGIPDGLKDKLFNRLQRGETKARGMGLGLYLVKSLVDSYHGRVWVEDRVREDHTKGSRFVVILPAEARRF